MTIHKFPTFVDRSWSKIEEGLYRNLRKRGMSPDVIEKTAEWAKAKFYEHNDLYPPPVIDFPADEETIKQAFVTLIHQRVRIFLDMLDMYADTIAAGDGGKKPPESH